MTDSENITILDGLAWAGVPEQVRVARIVAMIVRKMHRVDSHITQTAVKDEIRLTFPPHGRGKAIFQAIWGYDGKPGELDRQKAIYFDRKDRREAWEKHLAHQAKRSTRLNNAYAAAFDRVPYLAKRSFPVSNLYPYYGDERRAWDAAEEARDKGDVCLALTHQGGHIVCLVAEINDNDRPHIAVRKGRGPVVRTYLRASRYTCPANLIEAAVSLGGPKVRAALAKGKRVFTDWVGRRSLIFHDGSDYVAPQVEDVTWHAAVYDGVGFSFKKKLVMILGDTIIDGPKADELPHYD